MPSANVPKYRDFVASSLAPDSRPEAPRLTAVVVGADGARSRAIASALSAEGWSVGEDSADGRALAAVVVLDRVTPRMRRSSSRPRVRPARAAIVIVGDPTVEAVRALLQAGADAVVPADAIETQLVPAMSAVHAGLAVAPRGTLSQAIERPALTPREKQVLGMVVLGFSNADIANKLYLAESTVKSHLSSAFAKLGVRTRSEATALILDRSKGLGTGILAIVGDGDAETA